MVVDVSDRRELLTHWPFDMWSFDQKRGLKIKNQFKLIKIKIYQCSKRSLTWRRTGLSQNPYRWVWIRRNWPHGRHSCEKCIMGSLFTRIILNPINNKVLIKWKNSILAFFDRKPSLQLSKAWAGKGHASFGLTKIRHISWQLKISVIFARVPKFLSSKKSIDNEHFHDHKIQTFSVVPDDWRCLRGWPWDPRRKVRYWHRYLHRVDDVDVGPLRLGADQRWQCLKKAISDLRN